MRPTTPNQEAALKRATRKKADAVPGLPVILSETTVCKLLNISASTARRYRKARRLGFCTYAGKVVYLPEQIEAFLKANEVKAAEEPRLRIVNAG